MTRQLSLLDLPSAPYVKGSPTSLRAARRIVDKAEAKRARILRLLRSRGPLTDWDIQQALDMDGNTERPRRRELEQQGLVRDSGKTRRLPSGRSAVKWEAV